MISVTDIQGRVVTRVVYPESDGQHHSDTSECDITAITSDCSLVRQIASKEV